MADKLAVQCSETTKAKFIAASKTLKWTMPEVLELAADLLAERIDGEETPAEKRARILGRPKSDRSATPVRQKSDNGMTPVIREPVATS